MSQGDGRYILAFRSYNQAMLIYHKLLGSGCNIELVSTPCRVSRGCSQSILFRPEDVKKIIEIAKNSRVAIKGIYKIIDNNGKKEYIHI